jgi:hypothetical protein
MLLDGFLIPEALIFRPSYVKPLHTLDLIDEFTIPTCSVFQLLKKNECDFNDLNLVRHWLAYRSIFLQL